MFKNGDTVVLHTPKASEQGPKVVNGTEAEVLGVWYAVKYGDEVRMLPATYVSEKVVTPEVVVETEEAETDFPKSVLPSMDEIIANNIAVGAPVTPETQALMEAITAAVVESGAESLSAPVPLVAEFEVAIDEVDHICYALADGDNLISVVRPKRKGRPSYKVAPTGIVVPEGAHQVPLDKLPEMAQKIFAEAGITLE